MTMTGTKMKTRTTALRGPIGEGWTINPQPIHADQNPTNWGGLENC